MVKTDEGVPVPVPERQPSRVVLENVRPEVDAGRFPVKRTLGEEVEVTADIHADGHDQLAAVLRYRRQSEPSWTELPMQPLVNDAWSARFSVTELEPYLYTIEAWIDHFATWRQGLGKKVEAETAEPVDLLMGAELVSEAGTRATGADAEALASWAARLRRWAGAKPSGFERALDEELAELMARWPDRRRAARYPRELLVWVDRERARFSAWYEMFPRSCATAARAPRHLRGLREAPAATSPRWASTCSTCRPSTRSAARTARARTTRPQAARATPAARGPSAPRRAATRRSTPQLGTLEDFRRLVAKARRARASRSPSTSPSSARPTTPT